MRILEFVIKKFQDFLKDLKDYKKDNFKMLNRKYNRYLNSP